LETNNPLFCKLPSFIFLAAAVDLAYFHYYYFW